MFTANFTFPLSGIWKNAMPRKCWLGLAVAMLLVLGVSAAEPDGRIKRMLDQNSVKYSISNGLFKLLFKDGNTVYVSSGVVEYKQIAVREIWTCIDKIDKRDSSMLYRMLRANSRLKLGAYSVVQSDDGNVGAFFTVKLPADADWGSLWSAILLCAEMQLPDED